jgi:transketolase
LSTTNSPVETLAGQDLEQRSVNAIRVLAMDAVQNANSGHPGAPLGLADAAYVLWSRFLRFDPRRPEWPNRDRFVLSAGHASMLQYAVLHLLGYAVSKEDIRSFRQWDSITPGHPEEHLTPGVETTTGPLGQGIATAVGMALAERHLAARLNTGVFSPVDHRTYVIASDGDMMEGVQSEAASMAGHLGLGKLIVFYDDNRITIDGPTSLAFDTEDVGKRYEAYGWHVQHTDGHDRNRIAEAFSGAGSNETQPSLIVARTHIAVGSPNKQDSASSHGSPLGEDEIEKTKQVYAWPSAQPFHVPEDVKEHFLDLGMRHGPTCDAWEKELEEYRGAHPEKAALWDALHHPVLPEKGEPRPEFGLGEKIATRKASRTAIEWLKPRMPALVGGSADLTPSNLTRAGEDAALSRENPAGRYLHFGIREHGMAAIMNGLAVHGGVVPYGGTFLVFSDYLRPSLRLAALMNQRVVYVFTHDSIFLGEDGPTHQPIAALPALRALPNLTVIRPSDPTETILAWEVALERSGPTALSLTRQGIPVLDYHGLGAKGDLRRGAYVLLECAGTPELIAFATGSEVWVTLEAAERLNRDSARVRVVAVPSWEIFFEQDETYRNEVLAPAVERRLAVEAASPFGWERFVGLQGEIHGIDRFGASAPASVLEEKFGFSADAIEQKMRRQLGR